MNMDDECLAVLDRCRVLLESIYSSTAHELVDGLSGEAKANVIISIVCAEFGMSLNAMLSGTRSTSWPRQVAVYLIFKHTGLTYPTIEKLTGTTAVSHALKKIQERTKMSRDMVTVLERLDKACGKNGVMR